MGDARAGFGQSGEDMAAHFLENLGYRVVAQRVRTHSGELDIIARDGPAWVFVEVKTRSRPDHGLPEEAFTPAKARKMARAVKEYMANNGLEEAEIRCDMVAVDTEDGAPVIRHYQSVLQGGGLA